MIIAERPAGGERFTSVTFVSTTMRDLVMRSSVSAVGELVSRTTIFDCVTLIVSAILAHELDAKFRRLQICL